MTRNHVPAGGGVKCEVLLTELGEGHFVSRFQDFDARELRLRRGEANHAVRLADDAQFPTAKVDDERRRFIDSEPDEVRVNFEHLLEPPEAVSRQKMLVDDRVREQIQTPGFDGRRIAGADHDA